MAQLSIRDAAHRMRLRLDMTGKYISLSENVITDSVTGDSTIVIQGVGFDLGPAGESEQVTIMRPAVAINLETEALDGFADDAIADLETREALIR